MEMTDNHTLEKNDFQYITLNNENIDKEHICCAFSDKKCSEGYELKKLLLPSFPSSGMGNLSRQT